MGGGSVLSVVVIGRDEGESLAACLRSAQDALTRMPHELIYVDSGSRDDSLAVARAAGARCFRLRTDAPTAGLGRRVGAREARGAFLLFLDGDMRLEPGFAETALAVLEAEGLDGAVGIRHDVYERGGAAVDENPNYYRCERRREAREFGGAILLRAATLARAGGWAADVSSCEEAELHARLLKCGARIAELPTPMIRHIDRVRDNRGLLGAIFSPRRLGLGQALRHALRVGSAPMFLLRERTAFLFWLIDALCIAALCAAGARAWGVVALAQALQWSAFALSGRARGFAGQKLLFFYLPAGMLHFRVRDQDYDAWT